MFVCHPDQSDTQGGTCVCGARGGGGVNKWVRVCLSGCDLIGSTCLSTAAAGVVGCRLCTLL
jgi:hypothetical protein